MSEVHVAVGVIVQPAPIFFERQILISKRPEHAHQGGLWEFPGGKVEPGEHVSEALARELEEELGIHIDRSEESLRPLIKIRHDYGDKQVVLDVWEVLAFSGEPHGREGQPVKWVGLTELVRHEFPAANRPIINACSLPRQHIITPEYPSLESARTNIKMLIASGAEQILLRQPGLLKDDYLLWLDDLVQLSRHHGVKLLASSPCEWLEGMDVDGVQLSWREAYKHHVRPVSGSIILGVSCHNEQEIKHAESLAADFITFSPICITASHPEVPALGWDVFSTVVETATMPVYALGGMNPDDEKKAFGLGAQGLAGIRLWQN